MTFANIRSAARFALLAGFAALAGCATSLSDTEAERRAVDMMKASFKAQGQASLARLEQDDVQTLCSKYRPGQPLPKDVAEKIEKSQLSTIKYPAKLMGDWQAGERVAQTGTGFQFSDGPTTPVGANCYACHQLSKQELSYGNIGPSLYQFGKLRGNSAAVQQYTYGKIYNSNAYSACSNMPRFGHSKILTEAQMADLTSLLLDPASPVNQ
jgi:sulfur-oxidizing protein SoxX